VALFKDLLLTNSLSQNDENKNASCLPDIFAMQEVDEIDEIKQMFSHTSVNSQQNEVNDEPGENDVKTKDSCLFQAPNHTIIWQKKHSRYSKDGCCVIFNRNRFELVHGPIAERYQENGKNHNQMMLIVLLKDNCVGTAAPQSIVCVGCTHLKAKEGFESMRHVQVKQLTRKLSDLKREFVSNQEVDTEFHTVVCGDFNETPDQLAIEEMLKNGFASVYPLDQGIWTTWKKRSSEVCHMIDYIFYKSEGSLQPGGYLHVMEKSTLPERLPAKNYPSDHVHLVAALGYANSGGGKSQQTDS